ncbi:uncharacterized protein LOC108666655 isoform X2 [Hyalella azteca]|uniref:Uncharacterized protein LOC108666655 isoform X2 n=1 Tax=Hyalella azteca TaxID=294128 RepID=A0A8B7N5B4_HYAAZ|nr:uncharacterized protein LOC108666655 isoform X2 [Hyalella azteca]
MGSLVRVLPALVAAISCFTALAIDVPSPRNLNAYNNSAADGPYYEFLDYAPDLRDQGMDNSIKVVCGTGVWLMYDDHYYGGDFLALFTNVNRCENYTYSNPNDKISSLRYAGSPDGLADPYYNLYERSFYGGNEFKGNTDAPNLAYLDMKVSSLAFTGNSPWTFFMGQNYTGEAKCVYPNVINSDGVTMHYYVAGSMQYYMGLADNSIRSVAKGCLSDNIIGHPH